MKKSVFVFIVLSVVASGINYLTYPLLARILPASQYVDITVSLSLLTQITTFLSSIIAITIGLSKSEKQGQGAEKIALLQSILFKLFLGIALVFLVTSPFILGRIKLPLAFTLPICAMMLVSIPIAIVSGYLNGKGKMIKLGLVTALSAALQCTIATFVALLTGNGLVSMLSMAFAQLVCVALIYFLFKSEKLPNIGDALFKKVHVPERSYIKKLVLYTFLSSIAIMCINLVQIADLLIVKTLRGSDVKFYTDIYVISRIVFFGGMIFIWPFLSEINTVHHHLNRKPFLRAMSFFLLISAGTIGGLYTFGTQITHLLFGAHYPLAHIQEIGTLSVIYKLLFLIITAVILYFIVLRSYTAVWLALLTSIFVVAYAYMTPFHGNLRNILITLDVGAGVIALISIGLFIKKQTPVHD